MISAMMLGLILTLPASLESQRSEVRQVVEVRKQEFLAKCYLYKVTKRCDQIVVRTKVIVIDDFAFRTGYSPTGLASGLGGGLNVRVAYYNRMATNDLALCAKSPMVRTRLEMHKWAGRNRYWLTAPFEYRCADASDLLPALVHEMCHNFGAKVGHMAGLDDCQTRKK